MAFTEFCCRSGGSNLNAGTRTGSSTEPGTAADLTYASGSWVASTGVFTVASGDPVADGVAVGDFCSVYADGSAVTGFVGRVTARTTTTITASLTAKAGTAPTDGTGNRTLKIGGAWKGPNAADTFPFNLATLASLTNSSSDTTRINLKNDQTYAMTVVITSASAGPYQVEGYTSSYGDGALSTISWSSGSFNHTITISGSGSCWKNIIVDSTGKSAAGENWNCTGNTILIRCVSKGSPRGGFSVVGSAIECEAYNGVGAVNLAGFRVSGSAICIRCISHDNSSNGGFVLVGAGARCEFCISDSNTGIGFELQVTEHTLIGCEAYNNTSDGVRLSNGSNGVFAIANCNLVKNGGYGINGSGSGGRIGEVVNCGFGAGTQANTSGATTGLKGIVETGTVNYASDVTPWVDPANGDFRINLAAAKGAGRGTFTQTASSYSGTVGYPDIGAAQAAVSGGGSRMVNVRGGADQ